MFDAANIVFYKIEHWERFQLMQDSTAMEYGMSVYSNASVIYCWVLAFRYAYVFILVWILINFDLRLQKALVPWDFKNYGFPLWIKFIPPPTSAEIYGCSFIHLLSIHVHVLTLKNSMFHVTYCTPTYSDTSVYNFKRSNCHWVLEWSAMGFCWWHF